MDTNLSVGSFIKFGWENFKKRPWFLIGASIVYIIISWVLSFFTEMLTRIIASSSNELTGDLVGFVLSFAVGVLIGMGFIALFLRAHDDIATASLSDLWHPKNFWNYLGVYVLANIIILGGFILLIVPGVIAMTAFLYAPYAVIDKGLGPVEALKYSARITKGNRLRILALLGAMGLISILGALALLVGLFVAIPVTILALVHSYRSFAQAADTGAPRVKLSGGEIAVLVVGLILPVLVIFGILSAVVLASLNAARERAQQSRFGSVQEELMLDQGRAPESPTLVPN